jgi:DHA1 family bicyclomycin/chloramphenicol resistance-like MFS transporter
MQPGLIVLILSLLLGLQPITTDLYLPALPALTEGFGAPMAHACRSSSGARCQTVSAAAPCC